jgi:ABC-type antimicrobial peptide transport system permease subunit
MRPLPAALGFGVLASWGVLKTGEGLYPIASLAGDVAPYAVTVVLLLAVAITTLLTVAYPASRRDPVMALRED